MSSIVYIVALMANKANLDDEHATVGHAVIAAIKADKRKISSGLSLGECVILENGKRIENTYSLYPEKAVSNYKADLKMLDRFCRRKPSVFEVWHKTFVPEEVYNHYFSESKGESNILKILGQKPYHLAYHNCSTAACIAYQSITGLQFCCKLGAWLGAADSPNVLYNDIKAYYQCLTECGQEFADARWKGDQGMRDYIAASSEDPLDKVFRRMEQE
jgi:hypothetical protein